MRVYGERGSIFSRITHRSRTLTELCLLLNMIVVEFMVRAGVSEIAGWLVKFVQNRIALTDPENG